MKTVKNIALFVALSMPIVASANLTDTAKTYAKKAGSAALYCGRKLTAEGLKFVAAASKVASIMPLALATCTAGSMLSTRLSLPYETLQRELGRTTSRNIEQMGLDEDGVKLIILASCGAYALSRIADGLAYYIDPTEKTETNKTKN